MTRLSTRSDLADVDSFPMTHSAKNISQQAASTVLSHPLAKPLAKHVPKPIAQFAFAPGEIASLAESAGVGVSRSSSLF